MAKHFKRVKEKELANGKIKIVPFDKLDMIPFMAIYGNMTEQQLRDSLVITSPDGVWYVDARNESAEYFAQMMEHLISESRYTLEGYRKRYAMEFKGVNFYNVGEVPDEKKSLAIGWLLIPYELKRRDVCNMYYKSSKIKAFPGGKC